MDLLPAIQTLIFWAAQNVGTLWQSKVRTKEENTMKLPTQAKPVLRNAAQSGQTIGHIIPSNNCGCLLGTYCPPGLCHNGKCLACVPLVPPK